MAPAHTRSRRCRVNVHPYPSDPFLNVSSFRQVPSHTDRIHTEYHAAHSHSPRPPSLHLSIQPGSRCSNDPSLILHDQVGLESDSPGSPIRPSKDIQPSVEENDSVNAQSSYPANNLHNVGTTSSFSVELVPQQINDLENEPSTAEELITTPSFVKDTLISMVGNSYKMSQREEHLERPSTASDTPSQVHSLNEPERLLN